MCFLINKSTNQLPLILHIQNYKASESGGRFTVFPRNSIYE